MRATRWLVKRVRTDRRDIDEAEPRFVWDVVDSRDRSTVARFSARFLARKGAKLLNDAEDEKCEAEPRDGEPGSTPAAQPGAGPASKRAVRGGRPAMDARERSGGRSPGAR